MGDDQMGPADAQMRRRLLLLENKEGTFRQEMCRAHEPQSHTNELQNCNFKEKRQITKECIQQEDVPW